VKVVASAVQSLYVVASNGLVCKAGTSALALCASDESLEVFEGIGTMDEFGAKVSPRVWNGVIHYDAVKSTLPPKCGNGYCDADEDSLSCSAHCVSRYLETTWHFDSGSSGVMFSFEALRGVTIRSLDVDE
jgi:hypothetical protein